MIIPTKERVLAGRVAAAGVEAPAEYDRLLENEEAVLGEVKAPLAMSIMPTASAVR